MSKILIVEEDREFRLMLRDTLKKEGYHIWEASNGQEALDKYGIESIDLMILDIILAKNCGIKAVVEMRRSHPGIKVIAISNNGMFRPDIYLRIIQNVGIEHAFQRPMDID